MASVVTCPQCAEQFEVPEERAGEAKPRLAENNGIQAGLPLAAVVKKAPPRDDESEPLRRPRPRSPFPLTGALIVALGLMFLLLAISIGFNIWIVARPDDGLRNPMAIQADLAAQERRAQAEQALAAAQRQEVLAQEKLKRVERDLEDAQRRLQVPEPMPIDQPMPQEKKDAQDWGSLEGRVTFKGELPKIESFEARIQNHADSVHLLKSPKEQLLDPTWRIDPKTRGVANVAVYIKRPPNGMLPIHRDDRTRKDNVVIDMPFCAFEPHTVALYPNWNDGKERGETGQKFILKNSSPISHAPRIIGDPNVNEFFFKSFPPNTEQTCSLNPQHLPLSIACSLHSWMHGHIWVLDHPYIAITKADGSFTIPRVPAGMEVQVMAWHESQGWLLTKQGKSMMLTKGKNTLDFEIGAK